MSITFKQFLESNEGSNYRPGELDDEGEVQDPDWEPDLELRAINRYRKDFGEPTEEIGSASGWITTQGEVINLGGYNRSEDHRSIIPYGDTMRKWGWPQDVADEFDSGTSMPAMYEYMRRSGIIRITSANKNSFDVQGFRKPTGAQRRVIVDFVNRIRPRTVTLEFPGLGIGLNRSKSFTGSPEGWEIEEILW